MPHILVLILVGVGLWAGYKLMRKEMARVERDLRKAEDSLARKKANGTRATLVRDPESGVYRPER